MEKKYKNTHGKRIYVKKGPTQRKTIFYPKIVPYLVLLYLKIFF